MKGYVIKFEGFNHYLDFICPVTGPRVTKDLDTAKVFNTRYEAGKVASALQPRVTSGATLQVREVRTTVRLVWEGK